MRWLAERGPARGSQWRGLARRFRSTSTAASASSIVTTSLLGRFNAETRWWCWLSAGARCFRAGGRQRAGRVHARRRGAWSHRDGRDATSRTAVIDYAHTPDALAKALRARANTARGTLWCVFGCGGDRDPGKRPIMGGIAESSRTRSSSPTTIHAPRIRKPSRGDILQGIKSRDVQASIHDRGDAIAAALKEAQRGRSWCLIAGKGHEDYQIYGDTRRSFSDRSEALRVLGGGGMKRTLSDAARVVGGELIGEDRPYGCVCTDSRTLDAGRAVRRAARSEFRRRGSSWQAAASAGRHRCAGGTCGAGRACRRCWCRHAERCRSWPGAGARDFSLPVVASPAATARPRPRK